MFTKTILALTFLFAAASGALAATKQQSFAPYNDERGIYDRFPLDTGRDCVRVAFPQCSGGQ